MDCQEPPRAFVLDDNGSLIALIRLVHQQKPLFTFRRTDFRVDLLKSNPSKEMCLEVLAKKEKTCIVSAELVFVQTWKVYYAPFE